MQRKGQFTPGNPGRKVGSKNRATPEIRQYIELVVGENMHRLQSDLDSMPPYARWSVLTKLMHYFLPALSRVESRNTHEGELKITVTYSDHTPPDHPPILE